MITAWKTILGAFAVAAGLIICGMFVVILVDVTLRSLRLQPPLWKATFVEFGLLYAGMLSAPWIASRDGNIRLRTLKALPDAWQPPVERSVMAVLAGLCLVLAWYAAQVVVDAVRFDEVEIRSIILPRWVLLAPIAPCLLITALEFLRQAVMGSDGRV